MGSDRLVEIPIDVSGPLVKPDETRTVAGGGTRLVKLVPIGEQGKLLFGTDRLPCIWRSHEVTQGADNNGQPIRVNKCLLLAGKDPPTVLPADVNVDAWKNFPTGPVEW